MTEHPDDAALAELAEGHLADVARAELEAHVEQCASCRTLLAGLLKALQPEDAAGPRKGLVVGRYVVLEPVGAGALGEVFAGFDTTLERTVALKWLYPSVREHERKAQRERLIDEARALARVQHPNVVAVHDVESQGAQDVIVMELVRGQSLRQRLAQRPPWREMVAAFADAGRGLAAAHAASVIHRDFKPDNVLIDATGRVRVADFGLARTSGDAPSGEADARRSTLSGTPAYLAPERWRGAAADALSNQFSFCASLYECLSGRLAFEERDVEKRLEAMRKGPAPLASGAPGRLEAAVLRGLAFDPARRWPSMASLVSELDAAVAPAKKRGVVLAGAAAVVCAVPLVVWYQSLDRCTHAGDEVASTWNPARGKTLHDAFTKTKQPSAAVLADRVVAALDAYATELSGLRVTACEATRSRGESDVVLGLRNACLQRRAEDLGALATVLETADEKTVERAVVAVESLPVAHDCLSASRVSVEPMPARASIADVARDVSRVRALRLAGKPKDSVALAETAATAARASAWRPLAAEALVEWANGLERTGKLDDARARYVEGLQLSLAANDLAQAYAAAVGLAYVEGVDGTRTQGAEAWAAVATALIEPAGLRGSAEALRVVNAEGIIQLRTQNHAEAAKTFAHIEAELAALGKARSVNTARAMQNRGAALRESGQAEAGLEASVQSLKLMEEVLAPAHPDVATAYNNIGSALADLKRYDEAETYYRRCIALRTQLYGEAGAPLATPHYNLGELAFRRGDGATALTEYGASRALVETTRGPDDDDAWDARMGEGLALGLLGKNGEAAETLGAVLPQLEKRKMPPWNIAQAKLGLATALRALGREPERVTALAKEVAALQGERHAEQRAQAEGLLR